MDHQLSTSSLSTAHEVSTCLTAAVQTAKEELETLSGMLPVATPDDLEHVALACSFSIALIRRCAAQKRKLIAQARQIPAWWQ